MNIIKPALLGVFAISILLSGCETTPSQENTAGNFALREQVANQPTQLMKAVAAGDLDTARMLIDAGNSVNVSTPQGSALSWAVDNKQVNAVMYLLSLGANPNMGIPQGKSSPLMTVAGEGETQLVRLMLAAGADVNYADSVGNTAIAQAAYNGHLTTVKTLLKAGANVNIEPRGRSLLMHIVQGNDLMLAQVLIAAGADVNFRDAAGISALKIAQEKNFADLEMLLVQSGAQS
jgi:ankyrin repeat protein